MELHPGTSYAYVGVESLSPPLRVMFQHNNLITYSLLLYSMTVCCHLFFGEKEWFMRVISFYLKTDQNAFPLELPFRFGPMSGRQVEV